MDNPLNDKATLTPTQKAAWVVALRSGEYEQVRNRLRKRANLLLPGNVDGYCCLGVACMVLGLEIALNGDAIIAPSHVVGSGYRALDPFISAHSRASLITMNDQEGKSFHQIADWVEENL